jgi:hypothetical protein
MLAGLGLAARIVPYSRVWGKDFSGLLGGWWLSKIIQCRIASMLRSFSWALRPTRRQASVRNQHRLAK